MYKHPLLIGTGRTALLAAKAILTRNIEGLEVYSNSPERAEAFVENIKDSRLKSQYDLQSTSQGVDIILDFSSTYPREQEKQDLERVIAENLDYDLIRKNEIKFNLPQKKKIYDNLRHINADVIMYTNPVDVMTAYVARKLGRSNIFGAGLQLDIERARKIISPPQDKMQAVGLHNSPIIIGERTAEFHEAMKEGIDKSLKHSRSKEDLYLTTQSEAINSLIAFLFQERETFHLSVPSKSIWSGEYTSATGAPVKWKDGQIVPIKPSLGKTERKMLSTQRKQVRKIITNRIPSFRFTANRSGRHNRCNYRTPSLASM